MKLERELAERVLDAVRTQLPEQVSVRRSGRGGLRITSKTARFSRSYSSSPAFGRLSRSTSPADRVAIITECVLDAVSNDMKRHDLRWGGLAWGPVEVHAAVRGSQVIGTVVDTEGNVMTLPAIPVPTGSSEYLPSDDDIEIDKIALWLLRVGIDQTGRLKLNTLWDAAIRGAVLADLTLNGRLDETADRVHVDAEPRSVEWEDAACVELLDPHTVTSARWISSGKLRATAVAVELVTSEQWSARFTPFGLGGQRYRADRHRFVAVRERLGHICDGDVAARNEAEAALAVLAHALNILHTRRLSVHLKRNTTLSMDCGRVTQIVEATRSHMKWLESISKADGGNPTFPGF